MWPILIIPPYQNDNACFGKGQAERYICIFYGKVFACQRMNASVATALHQDTRTSNATTSHYNGRMPKGIYARPSSRYV